MGSAQTRWKSRRSRAKKGHAKKASAISANAAHAALDCPAAVIDSRREHEPPNEKRLLLPTREGRSAPGVAVRNKQEFCAGSSGFRDGIRIQPTPSLRRLQPRLAYKVRLTCTQCQGSRECECFRSPAPAALARVVRVRFADVEAGAIDDFRSLYAPQLPAKLVLLQVSRVYLRTPHCG